MIGIGIVGRIVSLVVAVVVGVGGMFAFFIFGELVVRLFPDRWSNKMRPWVFVGPTLLFLFVYLVYPVVKTFFQSLHDARILPVLTFIDRDSYVGLDNYAFVFGSADMLIALRNNLIWLIAVTVLTVSLGLIVAVLTDRVKYEPIIKSAIFLPMAISAVGAGVIWKFIFAFRPAGRSQVGLLNAVTVPISDLLSPEGVNGVLGTARWVALLVGVALLVVWFIASRQVEVPGWLALSGGAALSLSLLLFIAYGLTTLEIPNGWLVDRTDVTPGPLQFTIGRVPLPGLSINNGALILAYIWIWVGFCMVILSAALKGLPKEILEAAEIDGATEWDIFWRITIPMISTTIAVVATTMVINVLKVFDIVFVMTNGEFDTDVVANRMYKEMFNFNNFGRASAIAVILLLAIVPVMYFNVRQFREQEVTR